MKKLLIVSLAALIVYACKHEIALANIVVPTNLVYSPTSSAFLKGTAGNSATPVVDNGGGTATFSITSTPVAGISIDGITGVLSWTSAVVPNTYDISVTAANSIGTTATTYRLTIFTALTAPTNLTYTPSSSTIVKGTIGNSATPLINNGGSTVTFSLSGTIPSGVSISSTTGVISWDNTVAVGNYNILVIATNNLGNTSTNYTLTVSNTPTVVAPTSFAYTPSSSSTSQGTAGSSATPSINNGLGVIAYSGNFISGVTINSTTGVISWNASVALGTYNFTITATNSAGSTTTSYSLTVTAAATNGAVCFSSEILPLYQTYCAQTGCHNSITARKGIILDSYNNIMNGIRANNPNSSKYYTVITNGGGDDKMPPSGSAQMGSTQISLIQKWINEGATNTQCAPACDTTQFTYTNGLSALFANNCNGCHGVAPGSGNVVLSDYASAKAAGTNMKAAFLNAINFTSAISSQNMPPSGQLSSCQVTQITKWINNGCPQ